MLHLRAFRKSASLQPRFFSTAIHGISAANQVEDRSAVHVQFADGQQNTFSALWLRDNCLQVRHPMPLDAWFPVLKTGIDAVLLSVAPIVRRSWRARQVYMFVYTLQCTQNNIFLVVCMLHLVCITLSHVATATYVFAAPPEAGSHTAFQGTLARHYPSTT